MMYLLPENKCNVFGLSAFICFLSIVQGSGKLDFSAQLIPEIAFTKVPTVKVSLALHTLPIDSVVTANCSLQYLANFPLDVDVSQDSPNLESDDDELMVTLSRSFVDIFASTTTGRSSAYFVSNFTFDTGKELNKTRQQSSTHNDDDLWKLTPSYFTFSKIKVQDVIVIRKAFPALHQVEFLLLQCTLSLRGETSNNVKLNDITSLLVADLSPSIDVNWTAASVQGNQFLDREYQNPGYRELARCPCDLKNGDCDINCCCDLDCKQTDIGLFSCIKGSAGGFSTPLFSYHNCDHNVKEIQDWFPFLCMTKHNTPFLGLNYINSPPIIREQKMLRSTLTKALKKSIVWEDDSTKRMMSDSSVYKYGSPIFTFNSDTYDIGTLSLPARTLTGQCIEAAPLQFQILHDTSCSVVVTPTSCVEQSLLSYTFYLSENSSDLQVLSRADTLQVVNLSVTYVCCSPDTDWTEDDVWHFLPSCDISILKPKYDPDLMICENVVHRVVYNFWWNGPEIVKVNVSVFLGNISLTPLKDLGPMSEFTQNFQTYFFHFNQNYNDSSNGTFDIPDYEEVTLPVVRSGNPGYDIGRMLITGIPKDDNGHRIFNESFFSFMDVSFNSSLRLIQSGRHGDCSSTGGPILFGVNGYSGCKVQLPEGARNSCLTLKEAVLGTLCRLLPSSYVSKGGNPQSTNLEDFIPIIREDYCLKLGDLHVKDDTTIDLCTNVPTHLEMMVFHSVSGYFNGFPFHRITGMRTRHINTTWPRCRSPNSEGTNGGCWDPESSNNRSLSIFVTSSIDFVETPPDLNPSTKKFWLIQNSAPCYRDSCWSEIAYPFVVAQEGDTKSYVTKWGLVLIVLGVIVLCLTKPFW